MKLLFSSHRMTTNTSPLEPLAQPPLSPSVQNEAIFQKIRFIGKIGLALNTILLVFFILALLAMLVCVIIELSDPSQKLILAEDDGINLLIFCALTVILEYTFCRIFRRFTPKDLLTQKTVKLIMWAAILTFMVSLVPFDSSSECFDCSSPSSGFCWVEYSSEVFFGTLNALTLLTFGYVLKISLNLKEENDHTV